MLCHGKLLGRETERHDWDEWMILDGSGCNALRGLDSPHFFSFVYLSCWVIGLWDVWVSGMGLDLEFGNLGLARTMGHESKINTYFDVGRNRLLARLAGCFILVSLCFSFIGGRAWQSPRREMILRASTVPAWEDGIAVWDCKTRCGYLFPDGTPGLHSL